MYVVVVVGLTVVELTGDTPPILEIASEVQFEVFHDRVAVSPKLIVVELPNELITHAVPLPPPPFVTVIVTEEVCTTLSEPVPESVYVVVVLGDTVVTPDVFIDPTPEILSEVQFVVFQDKVALVPVLMVAELPNELITQGIWLLPPPPDASVVKGIAVVAIFVPPLFTVFAR